jgi:hypothetical protein
LIPGADNAVVVATVGPEVAVGPGLVSVFPCGGVVTWPESVCEVAAIAAAAIASGGVEPPEVGVAAGVFVGAVLTESVTGTATGVVTVDCWARIAGSAVGVSPLVGWSVVLAGSSFAPAVLASCD